MADMTFEEALSGIAALAHQYATSDVSYIWQAEGTILEARYAIAAIFGLQVYEWISGCVAKSANGARERNSQHQAAGRNTFGEHLYLLFAMFGFQSSP